MKLHPPCNFYFMREGESIWTAKDSPVFDGTKKIVASKWDFNGKTVEIYKSDKHSGGVYFDEHADFIFAGSIPDWLSKEIIFLNFDGTERSCISIPKLTCDSQPDKGFFYCLDGAQNQQAWVLLDDGSGIFDKNTYRVLFDTVTEEVLSFEWTRLR